MIEPDLDLARRFVDSLPIAGRPLLVGITGSHHYGFPSPDSDLDIKGIHVAPTDHCLGLRLPEETHDTTKIFEGVECDTTLHELRKALNLLLRGNGNMLERIFSPYQLYDGAAFEDLRRLALANLSQRSFDHYDGYFRGCMQEFERGEERRAKPMLYCYRVALTGVHFLRTSQVVANLSTLAPIYGFDDVQQLIDKKCATFEQVELNPAESDHYRARWPELRKKLHDAREHSSLPLEPEGEAQVSDWLRAFRLNEIQR